MKFQGIPPLWNFIYKRVVMCSLFCILFKIRCIYWFETKTTYIVASGKTADVCPENLSQAHEARKKYEKVTSLTNVLPLGPIR
jgi:hypothetical protein